MSRFILLAFLATAFAHENFLREGPCVIAGKFGLFPQSKIFFECSLNSAYGGLSVIYYQCEDNEYFSNSVQKCISKLRDLDLNGEAETTTLLEEKTTQGIQDISSLAPEISTEEAITVTEESNATPEIISTTEIDQESSSDLPEESESTEGVTDVTTEENISFDPSTLIPESTEDVSSSTIEGETFSTDITESISSEIESSTEYSISTEDNAISTTEVDLSSTATDETTEVSESGTDASLSTDDEVNSSSTSSTDYSISTTDLISSEPSISSETSISTEIIPTNLTPTEENATPVPTVFTCPMAGLFPVESKCNQFYKCRYNHKNLLVPIKVTCRKGHNFNPYKQNCVYETKYSTCKAGNFLSDLNEFHCSNEGFFAHKKDCSLYFNCSLNFDKTKFLVSIRRCPPGQIFNLSTNSCTHRTLFSCFWRPSY